MLLSRKEAVSKILPITYISQTWLDHDYAVLHQINSTYTEIIVMRICPDNNHDIAYVSFLHSTRIDVLNGNQRKLFKEMMDVILENSTETMFSSIIVESGPKRVACKCQGHSRIIQNVHHHASQNTQYS